MNSFNVLYAIPLSLILGAPVSAQSQYYPPNYYGGGGVNSPVVVPPTVINNAPPKTYMENESKKSCRESEIDLFLFGIRRTTGDCTP
tara:strand:+ start:490 stop:750 length:261 start_codon:yes stop_codon:yes gene_type:complete